ncbi:MAG: ABC transporter permease [Planctomycetota bacterium]
MATVGLATNSSTPDRPPRITTGRLGAVLFLIVALPCFLSLPWSLSRYDLQRSSEPGMVLAPPSLEHPMGTDELGRSLLWRCLLGGAISLGIGISAALIAVFIGVTWGALSGYGGGKADAAMMRTVDVLYGLPYILLVVMISLALQPVMLGLTRDTLGMSETLSTNLSGILTLLIAIGGVSWLTMSRVIRGQVLSLRAQPFIEATRAVGMGPLRVLRLHLLPNLTGVIVVYATLAVPLAILQESFLSFLGIGVRLPLPSWGNLAAEGVKELPALTSKTLQMHWWLLVFPCVLLGLTLMALNFLGDMLRDRFDPKRGQR